MAIKKGKGVCNFYGISYYFNWGFTIKLKKKKKVFFFIKEQWLNIYIFL